VAATTRAGGSCSPATFVYLGTVADDIALLLRRAGFGPTAEELATARTAGYTATLSALFEPSGPDTGAQSAPLPQIGPDPFAGKTNPTQEERVSLNRQRDEQIRAITHWWLDRMTVAKHQAVERLVFFWHGHWATSALKVRSAQLMLGQHRTLRDAPDFAAMARQMVFDPALIYWLDGHINTKKAPNENLARELMELFLLGIGQYTENDVKEAGRALTGWWIDIVTEKAKFNPRAYDTESKTILGTTKNFDAASLVDLLLQREACPRFIASRLWFRYASATEPMPNSTRDAIVAAFPAPTKMLRALMSDDAFQTTAETMVKQPVEWFVGAMRQLGLRLVKLPPASTAFLVKGLESLGQLPFAPPSVGGWPAGAAWLTSATAKVRLNMAAELAKQVRLDRLTPESLAELLCLDKWSDRTYALLRDVQDQRALLTLGLASPDYLVS
jgi:uncharacterized protein (DUF1800 family)